MMLSMLLLISSYDPYASSSFIDVVDVNNVNQFKARLDKLWMHQDVKFDFTAELTGIGYRSVRVMCDV